MYTKRWELPNRRVITVGIGWVLQASATSGFGAYIISLPTAPLPRGSSSSVVRISD